MSETETRECFDCKGSGQMVVSHVSYGDGSCGWNVPGTCSRCQGTGRIPEAATQWSLIGGRMRLWRLKNGRTLSAEAKRREMRVVTLSRMEMGYDEPVPPVPLEELP